MKMKILLPILTLSMFTLPTVLASCSAEKSRNLTDDINVTNVEIPNVEVNKDLTIKATIKKGFMIDFYKTEIKIKGQKLNFSNRDFTVEPKTKYSDIFLIKILGSKITSDDITVKIVSAEELKLSLRTNDHGWLITNNWRTPKGSIFKDIEYLLNECVVPAPSSYVITKWIDLYEGTEIVPDYVFNNDQIIQAIFGPPSTNMYI